MHAAGKQSTAYEPHPLWFRKFGTAVILSDKQQNGDATSVNCSSKTPDAAIQNSCDWSRAYCVITIWRLTLSLADNCL